MFDSIDIGYVNISGNLYSTDFINLVTIKNDAINFDDRTRFLSEEEKKSLNNDALARYDNYVFIVEIDGVLGVICDFYLSRNSNNKIKAHELVLPDTVQGMVSNYSQYNGEAAPVLLSIKESVRLDQYRNDLETKCIYELNNVRIFILSKERQKQLLSELNTVKEIYVADGHHRLYSTRLSSNKESVFSFVVPLEALEISSIDRVIPNITEEEFMYCLDFLNSREMIVDNELSLRKGIIKMTYRNQTYTIRLIDLKSDAFWNNDVYRFNTQVLSQGFRIFDSAHIDYINCKETAEINLTDTDVLVETYPMSKTDFTDATKNNLILPPKTTYFSPKFPSLLMIKKYA